MVSLSILIPVYNADVVGQVSTLRRQCMAITWLGWEIVVVDDGSPRGAADNNSRIDSMLGCRLIRRERNHGRAATRNYLARAAKNYTLLYIDSGLVPPSGFVRRYVESIGSAKVVCGTVDVDRDAVNRSSLRCLIELEARKRFTAARCAERPYKNFHTTAFMIDRRVMLDNPMREDITTYGHEDTLFGKQLEEKGISIAHIDNPVLFRNFESNARYLEKTREAIGTLYDHRHELEGYSNLLSLACMLRKWHFLWIVRWIGRCLGGAMERNLCGKRPSLTVFNIYRVCEIAKKNL